MNKKYKPYIAYLLTGIPFSLLAVFFGIVHAIYFMSGMLLGWQTYRTYIKLKQSQGSIYALKFMQLINAVASVVLGALGFLIGVGILYLIKVL